MIRTLARSCLLVLVPSLPAVAAGVEIELDFRNPGFDRGLFRTELGYINGNHMNFTARWEAKGKGLRATVPPGKPGRPPMRFECLMRLEGDFEVATDFTIARFPRPRPPASGSKEVEPRNLIEIAIASRGRKASVWRYHLPTGEGYASYAILPDGQGVHYRGQPIQARTSPKSARLALKRSGGSLVFSQGGDDGSLREVGSCDFGDDPIDELELHVWPMGTADALDVRFDRLRIAADRIVELRDASAPSWLGAGLWGLGAAAVAAAGLLAWRRRASASPAPWSAPR